MKKLLFTFLVLICSTTYFGCKKSTNNSGSGNQQNDLQTQLQGKWNLADYIAYDIPNLPNDTTIPIHSESISFSEDSLSFDSWCSFFYDESAHPPFYVTQTAEFKNSVQFSVSGNYIIANNGADTVYYVNKISASKLVLQTNPNKFIPFNVITELEK